MEEIPWWWTIGILLNFHNICDFQFCWKEIFKIPTLPTFFNHNCQLHQPQEEWNFYKSIRWEKLMWSNRWWFCISRQTDRNKLLICVYIKASFIQNLTNHLWMFLCHYTIITIIWRIYVLFPSWLNNNWHQL